MDLRRSRLIAADAVDSGLDLARLYVDVVRPALHAGALETGGAAEQRLMFGSVEATLAMVASRPIEGAGMRGEGREALVSVGSGPLDRLDGQVIVDVLRGDGWRVETIEAGTDAGAVAAMADRRHVQLVVMPTSNPADLLKSAAAYTRLRRLPDPPVIVACSLGHPDETTRARAVGADAFVNDPDALLRFVDSRLPGRGERNWGVRLRRIEGTLIIAPTGDLDAGSVRRLREVVDSRSGTYKLLIVDTRFIAGAAPHGALALTAWLQELRSARMIMGEAVRDALTGVVVDERLLAQPTD